MGGGVGGSVMDLFVFFCFSGDKEIQCTPPCWDDKLKRSNVFRGELFVSFYVGFLVESQPVVK